MPKLQKTWGDIFRAALRRGCDHGYAGYLADKYEQRKEKERRDANPD